MAKVKYGDIVVELRGSKGGAVYSKNKYGYYVKPNAVPINPQSLPQQEVRAVFSQFTKSWGALTDLQRTAWNNFAAVNPITDTLGNVIYLTGANWYLRLNLNRVMNTTEATVIEDAPADTVVETCIIDLSGVTAEYSTPDFSVQNIGLLSNVVTTPAHILIAELTPPLRPGQNSIDNMYRFFRQKSITATSLSFSMAPYNEPIKVGDVLGLRLTFYNTANGSMAGSQSSKITVVAG